MKRRGGLTLSLALLAAWPARAEEPPASPTASDDEATYRQKVADAVAEYDRGNWAEARALFLEAHASSPSARTWRVLGMTAFELRDYVVALRELRAALADPVRPLEAELRAEVEALHDRTRAFVGRFTVRLSPPGTTLLVDGRPAQLEPDGTLFLALGEHSLRADAEGHVSQGRVLRVYGREQEATQFELEPVPEPEPVRPFPPLLEAAILPATTGGAAAPPPAPPDSPGARTWTWVAAAGAVAFGGAALGFRLASDSEFEDLKRTCRAKPSGACRPGEVDESDLDTLETLTTASVITAGAAAVAAIVLYFVEGGEGTPEATVAVAAGRAGLAGSF